MHYITINVPTLIYRVSGVYSVIRFRVQSLFHLCTHSILYPTMCAGQIRLLERNQHQRKT
jgi:hypothetical protein